MEVAQCQESWEEETKPGPSEEECHLYLNVAGAPDGHEGTILQREPSGRRSHLSHLLEMQRSLVEIETGSQV